MDRDSIIEGLREAWSLVPDMPFGMLVEYILEGDHPNQVSDDEVMVYINDFVRNNM